MKVGRHEARLENGPGAFHGIPADVPFKFLVANPLVPLADSCNQLVETEMPVRGADPPVRRRILPPDKAEGR